MMDARVSVWILGDQLLAAHPAVQALKAQAVPFQVVMVESLARAQRLPYQRKKLVMLFSAMRHYAQRLAAEGISVDYRLAEDVLSGLRHHIQQYRPAQMVMMAASEYAGRRFQDQLDQLLGLPVQIHPNTQFLTGQFDPAPDIPAHKRVVQETFYRSMRRHFNLLMEPDGRPAGAHWNFDDRNRQRLPKGMAIPARLSFEPDQLTRQVMVDVSELGGGIGSVGGFNLAVTQDQAQSALLDFIDNRLANFGPYEDAMSQAHPLLFHSFLSPYLNIGLLEPLDVARQVEKAYRQGSLPLNSAEGFIRQVIGWREYMVWQYWRQMPELRQANFWSAARRLPDWFWNGQTEMNCLRTVIERAIQIGYNHHIERLMILSNFCLLAGVEPMAVNDWFSAVYVDAYEWVMLPNVLGMGLYADGGRTATKPYIASANYIRRMSDYCSSCRFNPRSRTGSQACPYNTLYWNFILENEATLLANPRMGPGILGVKRIAEAERAEIRALSAKFLSSF
jgi:deoxyribodipyrimidine photolyase-related protein